MVNQWVGELPESYSSDPAVAGLFSADKPKRLPRMYRWFRRGHDKRVVIVGSTGASLSILILLGAGIPIPPSVALVCAVAGIAIIVWHVWSGSRLAARYGDEFERALEAILVALGKHKADSESNPFLDCRSVVCGEARTTPLDRRMVPAQGGRQPRPGATTTVPKPVIHRHGPTPSSANARCAAAIASRIC